MTDATTYTRTVAADASAIVVGQCATARGEADDSGKVTATSITVSAPTDGECSSGDAPALRWRPGGGRRAPRRTVAPMPELAVRPSVAPGAAPAGAGSSGSATAGAVVLVAAGGGVALAVGGSDDSRYRTAAAERVERRAGHRHRRDDRVGQPPGRVVLRRRHRRDRGRDGRAGGRGRRRAGHAGHRGAAGRGREGAGRPRRRPAAAQRRPRLADVGLDVVELDRLVRLDPVVLRHPHRFSLDVHGAEAPAADDTRGDSTDPAVARAVADVQHGAAGAPRPVPGHRRRAGRQRRRASRRRRRRARRSSRSSAATSTTPDPRADPGRPDAARPTTADPTDPRPDADEPDAPTSPTPPPSSRRSPTARPR